MLMRATVKMENAILKLQKEISIQVLENTYVTVLLSKITLM